MTLKQFFQLAGGIVVALIFYSTPILPIIKWPFVIISAVLGIALAFFPLEERPLEKWIFAFFRAIYAPTEYFWKKTVAPEKFFMDEPPPGTTANEDAALKQYLGPSNQKESPLSKLENGEKGFLSGLTNIVSGLVNQATGGVVTNNPITPNGATSNVVTQSANVTTQQTEQEKQMTIPQNIPVKVSQPGAPHLVVEEKPVLAENQTQVTAHQVAPIIAGEEIVSTRQALFSVDAAPPNPPTIPNVIVGQIVDQDRKIVEGAIMEVRDSAGRPIRALRSNKVGHFITVTPLDPGKYDIVTEKDGYEFTPVSFEANGNLIPPILVQGVRHIQIPIATETKPISQGVVINQNNFTTAGQ